MTVLPYKFDEHALMCDFDRTGDFFNWFAFVDQANSVFNSCHSWSKYNGAFYRYQRYPILSMCYPDQLLQTKGVELPFVPVICPGVLTSHPVYLEENHFHVIDKLTQDDVALRSVRFFLPALVWGYNELKKALLQDEITISNAAFEVDLQHFAAMSNPDHADVPVRRDYGDIDEQFTTGTGRTAREQLYWRSSLARTKELENQMRLQMEYEASRNTWQSGWVVGRGGVPVRPEAGRGGPIVVQGTTAGQVAGHTAGLPPASAQHQHEGNTFLEWHYLRNNPTAPLADEEELIQEDLERMGIDPEAAAARGALPHVPTPVPSDQVQRVEGFVKESTYLMFCILIGTDLNAMNREEVEVLELVSRVSKCPRGCCRGPKPERLGGASEGGETPGRMQRTLQCTSFKVRQGLQGSGHYA